MVNRLILFCVLVAPVPALAQVNIGGVQGYIGRASSLTNVLNRPTVSPYLRLLQSNGQATSGLGAINNVGLYQTSVRPQLERRRQTQQTQQQIRQIQGQLNRIQQDFRRPTGGAMSTGHPTRFMSFSHYYPGLGR